MNALNREIGNGDEIVIRQDVMKPEYQKINERIFVCEYGPGMQADARGHVIYGYFLSDGKPSSILGRDIDPDATAAYHLGQSRGEGEAAPKNPAAQCTADRLARTDPEGA